MRIVKSHMSVSAVPEVVSKHLSENPSMQLDIPVAFLARGPGSEELLEAASRGQAAELKYETLMHFAALDANSLDSPPDSAD